MKGLRGRLANLWDGMQGWILVFLTGLLTACVAGAIDISEGWLFNIKDGYCQKDWRLKKGFCCADSLKEDCADWLTWSEALEHTSIDNYWIDYIMYILFAVSNRTVEPDADGSASICHYGLSFDIVDQVKFAVFKEKLYARRQTDYTNQGRLQPSSAKSNVLCSRQRNSRSKDDPRRLCYSWISRCTNAIRQSCWIGELHVNVVNLLTSRLCPSRLACLLAKKGRLYISHAVLATFSADSLTSTSETKANGVRYCRQPVLRASLCLLELPSEESSFLLKKSATIFPTRQCGEVSFAP